MEALKRLGGLVHGRKPATPETISTRTTETPLKIPRLAEELATDESLLSVTSELRRQPNAEGQEEEIEVIVLEFGTRIEKPREGQIRIVETSRAEVMATREWYITNRGALCEMPYDIRPSPAMIGMRLDVIDIFIEKDVPPQVTVLNARTTSRLSEPISTSLS
jgi:hypothetical protein